MAVTNFRAEDFPQGKKGKEQHNVAREDNLILDAEVEKAVRDSEEGNNFAKEFAKKDAAAEETLADEVKHAVEEGTNEEQTADKASTRRKSTPASRAAKAADKHIADEVAKATTQADDAK